MRIVRVASCLLALSLGSCQPGDLPGEHVGTYRITGTLMENSCGATALPAQDPLEFRVQLRGAAGLGTWIIDKPPGFAGTLTDDGAFRFQRQYDYVAIEPGTKEEVPPPQEVAEFLLPAPAPVEAVGCTLVVRETIEGRALRTSRPTMDGGTPQRSASAWPDAGEATTAADLQAANEIEIVAQAGSDCRAVLAEQGGPFMALPCVARYELSGELATGPASSH